jgi:hypothetical protein
MIELLQQTTLIQTTEEELIKEGSEEHTADRPFP